LEAEETAQRLRKLLDQLPEAARVHVQAEGRRDVGQVILPRSAVELIQQVMAQLARGNAVTVVPVHAELTTQEAADFLNVSRPFLIKLLEKSEIPFRKVGTRRRVLFADIEAYRHRDDERRRKTLEQLTREAEELGLGY
jgi:excisionase family DNA binding protein